MTEQRQVLHALRGPLSDADREHLALSVVYEAAHALERLAGLRQRFEAAAVMIDGELQQVERSFARALSALSQLSEAVEELEAVAEHVADTLAR